MKSIKLIFMILIISISFFQFNGCTVVGLFTGLYSDASQVDEFNQATFEIHNFDPGTSMDVFLTNGDTISGEFLRLDSIAADKYAARYENYRQSMLSEVTFPQLYDSIAINQNNIHDNIFLGFDYGCMKVKMKKYNSFAKIYLTNINHICDSENNCIESEKLRKIIAKGDIPLLSDLVLQRENTEVKIPTEDLVQGKLTDKHYGWLYGLSAGIVVDAFIVIFVLIPSIDLSGMGGWGQ